MTFIQVVLFGSNKMDYIKRHEFMTIEEIKELFYSQNGFYEDDVYVICNGKRVCSSQTIQDGKVYHVVPRLPGGKGGFGSMLRAIGAQIDKTNNREACRDLSGRRMRDVNNEKQMKEWLSKQSQREKEKEERRRERWERRKAMPNHKFDDPLYDQQRALVSDNLEDALQKGLSKAQTVSSTVTSATASSEHGRKRTSAATVGPAQKVRKNTEWIGIDVDGISDLDSDESETEVTDGATACPVDSATNKPQSDFHDDSNSVSNQSSTSDPATSSSEDSKVESLSNKETNCIDKFIIPLESNIESDEGMDFQIKIDTSDNSVKLKNDREAQNDIETFKQTVGNDAIQEDSSTQIILKDTEPNGNKDSSHADAAKAEVHESGPIDLDQYISAEDLIAVGLDRLKEELMARQLKCGGTLQERAQRLFSVKGLTKDQIDPALFAKPAKGKKKK